MAHQWARCNLANAIFPFSSDLHGRTIIVPQYDQNFDKTATAYVPDQTKDKGLPQAYYMHNVLPTVQGYQSIGYKNYLAAVTAETAFDECFVLEYSAPQVAKFLFSPAGGKNYVYDINIGTWAAQSVRGNEGSSAVTFQQAALDDKTFIDVTWKLNNGAVLTKVGAYSNTALLDTITATITTDSLQGAVGNSGKTVVDNGLTIPNGVTITHISIYSQTADSITAKVLLENSTTSYTSAYSEVFAHTGSGWETFTLASPYAVPGSGTYRIGTYTSTVIDAAVTAITCSYFVGNASGTQVFISGSGNPRLTSFTYTGSSTVAVDFYILLKNSGTSFTVAQTLAAQSHTGNGWEDFALAYTVPASGDYYLGARVPYGSIFNYNSDNEAATRAGSSSGTQTDYVTDFTDCISLRATSAAAFSVEESALVTEANVNGDSYIFYEGVGCFKYDHVLKCMEAVTFTGLQITNIKGCCSANGYMIVWSDTDIAISAANNATNFTPSLATGSSSESLQFRKGKINFCVPINQGFLVFCEGNIISATYQNNVRYPYNYVEVAGSGGCARPEYVSWQNNAASVYAITTAGIQEINRSKAEPVFADLGDFLAAQIFEDMNDSTLVLTTEYLDEPLLYKLTVIANRWLVVSYGKTALVYTHALVYDLTTKRWGKVKVNHRDCFEWNFPYLYGELAYDALANTPYADLGGTTYNQLSSEGVVGLARAKQSFCFLQEDGKVVAVDFALAQETSNGVLLIGKFEFVRNKFIIHQQSDVENVRQGNNFKYYIIPSIDGKTLLPAQEATLNYTAPQMQRFGGSVQGLNITLAFLGAFNLTSVLIDFTLGGDN